MRGWGDWSHPPSLLSGADLVLGALAALGAALRQVQRDLEVLADVTRYIRVVLLGIGPDVNMEELKAIADTTGGAAFQVNSPEEMQLIFLQALLS